MAIEGAFIGERAGITFRTIGSQVFFFFLESCEEEFAELPDCQGVDEADAKTDECCFNIFSGGALEGDEPVVIIEYVEEKTYYCIEFPGGAVAVDNKDQD